jgi:hypothetical protein
MKIDFEALFIAIMGVLTFLACFVAGIVMAVVK